MEVVLRGSQLVLVDNLKLHADPARLFAEALSATSDGFEGWGQRFPFDYQAMPIPVATLNLNGEEIECGIQVGMVFMPLMFLILWGREQTRIVMLSGDLGIWVRTVNMLVVPSRVQWRTMNHGKHDELAERAFRKLRFMQLTRFMGTEWVSL